MSRSEKWPELDDVAAAVVDKFLAVPRVNRSQPKKYDGKRRTGVTTEGTKPVAPLADVEPGEDYSPGLMRPAPCRFEEPCTERAWRVGLCRHHYGIILTRKRKAAKEARRF